MGRDVRRKEGRKGGEREGGEDKMKGKGVRGRVGVARNDPFPLHHA